MSELSQLMTKALAQEQRKLWFKLMAPLSIFITFSAGPTFSTPNIHWLPLSFCHAAFGVSLQGLLLTLYLIVRSNRVISRTVERTGVLSICGGVMPFTVVLRGPMAAVILSLVLALVAFLARNATDGMESDARGHTVAFRVFVFMPVGFTFACIACMIGACKKPAWITAGSEGEPRETPYERVDELVAEQEGIKRVPEVV